MHKQFSIFLLFFLVFSIDKVLLDYKMVKDEELIWEIDVSSQNFNKFSEEVNIPDDFRINEKLKGIKIVISDTEQEGKDLIITAQYFTTTDESLIEWKNDQDITEFKAEGYDKDLYSSSEFLTDFIFCDILFVPDNVDWEEFEKEVKDSLENDNSIEDYSIEALESGFTLSIDYDGMQELSVSLEYSEQGVLSLYELSYDGETVVKMVKQEPFNIVLFWIIFSVIVIIGLGSFFYIKKKKFQAKTKTSIQKPSSKKEKYNLIKQSKDPRFECTEEIKSSDIPPSLRTFIEQQKSRQGIIKPENLPKSFRKRGIIYCRYDATENELILRCFSQMQK